MKVGLVIALCLAIAACADTKHVGDSRTWQGDKVGDMGHGAGDGGLSQAIKQQGAF